VWPAGSRGCWIIDPGGLAKPVISAIREHELNPEMIVITHGHWDHFLANRRLRDRWANLPIIIHTDDADALEDPNVNMSMSFLGKLVKSPPADRLMNDRDRLTLGDFEFEVIHTPGHSPGSVCLYCHAEKIAFVGDLIFAGGGVGRTDLPRASNIQLGESIEKLFARVDQETTLYPGHGPSTIAARERALLI